MKKRKIYKKIILRVIFLPVIFLLLLLVTTWTIVKTMFTQSALDSILTNQLQNVFNRPVQIKSARFSFPGQIQIKGCKILENAPLTGENFIIADSILVTYKLLPLLKKKIAVDKFFLISPKIQLVKLKQGTWNVSDMLTANRQGRKSYEINKIKKAEIKDGTINIKNLSNNISLSFENTRFVFNNFNFEPEEESIFSLSAFFKNNAHGKYLDGRVYSEGAINLNKFNWDESYVKNLVIHLTILNKPITINCDIKNIKYPQVSFSMDVPGMDSKDLSLFFKSSGKFVVPPSKWSGNIRTQEPAKFLLHDVIMETEAIKLKINGDINFSTDKPLYNLTFHVQPFELSRLNRFKYKIPVANLSGKSQLKINVHDSDRGAGISKFFFSTFNAGVNYQGMSFSDINLTMMLSESSVNNYIRVTRGTVNFMKQKISNLFMDTAISKQDLKFSLSGRWDAAHFKTSASIKSPLSDKKMIDLTGYFKKLKIENLQSLVSAFRKKDAGAGANLSNTNPLQPDGKISLWNFRITDKFSTLRGLFKVDSLEYDYFNFKDFYIYCLLKNHAGSHDKLNGSVSFKTGSGIFYDVHEKAEKDRIYSIIAMPLLMMYRMNRIGSLRIGTTLKNIHFNSMGGEYSFKSGNILIKNFFIDGKDFSSYCTGSFDLINKTIRLKVYTIFSRYYSMGGLPESFTDSSGKPALAFFVHGSMDKPSVDILSPRDNTKIINEIVSKGIRMDLSKINQFISGGKK